MIHRDNLVAVVKSLSDEEKAELRVALGLHDGTMGEIATGQTASGQNTRPRVWSPHAMLNGVIQIIDRELERRAAANRFG